MQIHVVPLLELLAADGAVVRGLHGPPVQVTLAMLVQIRHLCISLITARLRADERTLASMQPNVIVKIRNLCKGLPTFGALEGSFISVDTQVRPQIVRLGERFIAVCAYEASLGAVVAQMVL